MQQNNDDACFWYPRTSSIKTASKEVYPRGRGLRIENMVFLKITSAYHYKKQMEPSLQISMRGRDLRLDASK